MLKNIWVDNLMLYSGTCRFHVNTKCTVYFCKASQWSIVWILFMCVPGLSVLRSVTQTKLWSLVWLALNPSPFHAGSIRPEKWLHEGRFFGWCIHCQSSIVYRPTCTCVRNNVLYHHRPSWTRVCHLQQSRARTHKNTHLRHTSCAYCIVSSLELLFNSNQFLKQTKIPSQTKALLSVAIRSRARSTSTCRSRNLAKADNILQLQTLGY